MNRLKELRKNKNLTQSDIAKMIGISQNNYSYWETGKVKIDSDSLKKLANFFEVTIDYILDLSKDSKEYDLFNRGRKAQKIELDEEDIEYLRKIVEKHDKNKK